MSGTKSRWRVLQAPQTKLQIIIKFQLKDISSELWQCSRVWMLCHWALWVAQEWLKASTWLHTPTFSSLFHPLCSRLAYIYICLKNTSHRSRILEIKLTFCPRKSNLKNCVAPNKGLCSACALPERASGVFAQVYVMCLYIAPCCLLLAAVRRKFLC